MASKVAALVMVYIETSTHTAFLYNTRLAVLVEHRLVTDGQTDTDGHRTMASVRPSAAGVSVAAAGGCRSASCCW